MSARLQPIDMRRAGLFGLNTESRVTGDDRWLSEGTNLVYDELGRMTARKGLTVVTTTGGHGTDAQQIAEYHQSATSSQIIHTANLKIYEGTTTLTDVTGTITTPTANNWQMRNFLGTNGESAQQILVGAQQGHTPWEYAGTAATNIVASLGTVPTGNCCLSAFGRLWITDADQITLKFCALGNQTDWGGAGAGSLDTRTVWPDGFDIITALEEWQDRLIIFGTRSILVYTGPEDPTASTFQLEDIIRTGTHFRDSVVPAGNDLFFMGDNGIESLRRAIEFSNLPLRTLTPQVSTQLTTDTDGATRVLGEYSPSDKALLYAIETTATTFYWYFDIGRRLEDGSLRAMQWQGIGYTAVFTDSTDTVYLGTNGGLATHSGYQDDGNSYNASWFTSATDSGAAQEKVLKTARFIIGCFADITMVAKWSTDFGETERSYSAAITCPSTVSEWNIAEWGLDEFSGGSRNLEFVNVPLSESGDHFQIGASVTVNGSAFVWSGLTVFAKSGRLAA